MTRNIYRMVIPSLKSLLYHNNIDKVYLLTEDDDVGFWLPKQVEVVNVSCQQWFKKSSPNYNNVFTWMVMMRMALCHVLPDAERILSLDLDTIIQDDITDLWDLPMDNKYVAGAIETALTKHRGYSYINCGVMMQNLDKWRDGMADHIIGLLNTKKYLYNEQDCMNKEIPEDGKLIIDPCYNYGFFNQESPRMPKILHFAAYGANRFKNESIVCKWGEADWGDIL